MFYAALIHAALQLRPAVGERGAERPHIVQVGTEALAELSRFKMEVERGLRDGGSMATMRDWGGKLVGVVCRIAGIFHGLCHAGSGDPAGHPIDAETMLCAMAIGEYALQHARAAYFEMGADPAVGLARRILKWLAEERRASFSARDAFLLLRGTVHTMDGMTAPLQLLEKHGYIRARSTNHPGPGRKPSTPYEVNPIFHAQNAQNAQKAEQEPVSADCAHSALGGGA